MSRIRTFTLLLVVAFIAAAPAAAQLNLNKLKKATDKALDVKAEVDRFTFSEQEEIELGLAISQRIRARYGVVQDPAVTRYFSLVGASVAAGSDRPELVWHWIILDSGAVNAFAAPGGYIHITRGALAAMDSEAELAGVLAHEVAHVTRQHTLKGLQQSMGMELAQNRAEYTAGSALFNSVADHAARAVLAGFGQAEELEADEVAVEVASSVGYQALGLTNFLGTLDRMQSGSSSRSALFRSHPETEERIKKANKQIKTQRLEGGVWVEDRYAEEVPYEATAGEPGGPAVAGARGMAESDQRDEHPDESAAAKGDEDEETSGTRFSLAQVAADPFAMGPEESSAEVTGAGAGRAIGEEAEEVEAGLKVTEIVEVAITPEELAAFQREGGLRSR